MASDNDYKIEQPSLFVEKKRKLWWVIIFAFIVLAAIIWLLNKREIEIVSEPEEIKPPVFTLNREVFTETLKLSGEIIPAAVTYLGTKAAGRIIALSVDEGDIVTAGTNLGSIDIDPTLNDDVERAIADLNIANANLQIAERNTAGGDELSCGNEEEDLDQTLLCLFNRVKEAEAIVIKRAQDLRLAQEALAVAEADRQIIAPFDGQITEKFAEIGQIVGYGEPVFAFTDNTILKVLTDIPDIYAGQVALGMPAAIEVEGFPEEYGANVTKIIPEVNPLSRNLAFELTLINTPPKAKIGMYTRIFLLLPERESYFVPHQFINSSADGPYVMLMDGTRRYIDRLGERGYETEIYYSGIREGVELAFQTQ